MKKIIAIALTITMLFGIVPTAFAATSEATQAANALNQFMTLTALLQDRKPSLFWWVCSGKQKRQKQANGICLLQMLITGRSLL